MLTPKPHPSMQANARTAGEMPNAAGSGIAAPSRAMTATGFRPIWPVAIRITGTSNGTAMGGRWAMNGASPAAGSAPPTATPMKPEPARTVASDRKFGMRWKKLLARRRRMAAARGMGLAVTMKRLACISAHARPTSGTIRVTAATSVTPMTMLPSSASSMTMPTRAAIRRWMDQDSVVCGRFPPDVAWRAADSRSSSQPIAAMPIETRKAIGSSIRIGAAGTAVETTAVIRFSGLQQFITAKPR